MYLIRGLELEIQYTCCTCVHVHVSMIRGLEIQYTCCTCVYVSGVWKYNIRLYMYMYMCISIIFVHKNNIKVQPNMEDLPSFYWLPKLHTNPYEKRFIASHKCTTKTLSKLRTTCFTTPVCWEMFAVEYFHEFRELYITHANKIAKIWAW